MQNLPLEILPAEKAQGFVCAKISNPSRHFFGEPQELKAVVKPINAMERALKISPPEPQEHAVRYVHQYYDAEYQDWVPCCTVDTLDALAHCPLRDKIPALLEKYGYEKLRRAIVRQEPLT